MSNISAKPATLDDWLALLESRHFKTIDMGLDRVVQVKERLQLQFACPVIMVAGTNGKGSTCAMLESILLRAGYKVGLYIKPHFLDFNERARIGGESASDAALIASFEAVGAILAVALLITPGATARLWTDRMPAMLLLATAHAILSTLGGYWLAHYTVLDTSAGGAITVAGFSLFIVSYLGSPRYGLIVRWWMRRRQISIKSFAQRSMQGVVPQTWTCAFEPTGPR